ncbi:MAG TPA: DsbA family oxidoreductase [Chryseosolibacter sp.]
MKIDIWSDIRCPFCYIGKRKFENALEQFPHRDKVEVVWHSFQLDPQLKTQPGIHVYDYLAKIKGMNREQTVQMHDHVTQAATEVGLTFDFDKAIVANSFDGHRLIQLAKAKGLANEAEEALFYAHFSEGKNIDDHDALLEIGRAIGLQEDDIKAVLNSNDFSQEVNQDEATARSIGIRGVPFFILNDKFAISGAQSPDVFLRALEKAWQEYDKLKVTPL